MKHHVNRLMFAMLVLPVSLALVLNGRRSDDVIAAALPAGNSVAQSRDPLANRARPPFVGGPHASECGAHLVGGGTVGQGECLIVQIDRIDRASYTGGRWRWAHKGGA